MKHTILAYFLCLLPFLEVQAQTQTQTFGYTGSVVNWTVPVGVTKLQVTIRGGAGGKGGRDNNLLTEGKGREGGILTGHIIVTPGASIQIAVGKRGNNGGGANGCRPHNNLADGAKGTCPILIYNGGRGGCAGPIGGSAIGGGGGAASVIRIGNTDYVAAGGGGGGASGNHTKGHDAIEGDYVIATTGVDGEANPADGSGGGGGGGGVKGGNRGLVAMKRNINGQFISVNGKTMNFNSQGLPIDYDLFPCNPLGLYQNCPNSRTNYSGCHDCGSFGGSSGSSSTLSNFKLIQGDLIPIDGTYNDGEISITYIESIPFDGPCLCLPPFRPEVNKKHVVSAWVKVSEACTKGYTGLGLEVNFDGQLPQFFKPSGAVIEGWQRIYGEFTTPPSYTKMSVKLHPMADGKMAVYFDDLRIHPFLSSFKSYVYDDVNNKLSEELDDNNYFTRYEYDQSGALERVKKETERGVMMVQESRAALQKK
jgi:hypothetical protein